MLREQKGKSCVHDAAERTVRIEVDGEGGPPTRERGTLLLDAKGRVVGVDVAPESRARVIVLLGRHEDVARTADVQLSVSRDRGGKVAWVIAEGWAGSADPA